MTLTPLVKWVGGKARYAHLIVDSMRANELSLGYCEPCVGAGAVFAELHNRGWLRGPVTLGDNNADLMGLYRGIQTNPAQVKQAYAALDARGDYKTTVSEFNTPRRLLDPLYHGVRLLWLVQHGFNGVVRYNRQGEWNVPPGVGQTTKPDDHIDRWHRALQGVTLVSHDLLTGVPANQGVLYVDPPYWPVGRTGFTGYAGGVFGTPEQRKLAVVLSEWAQGDRRQTLVTNHDLPEVHAAYDGWTVLAEFQRRNSVSRGVRALVGEVLLGR